MLLRSRNRLRPKSADSPLDPVAWLVGGTWTSDVKDPQDGSVTHVENHITWAPNHQAIQFRDRLQRQAALQRLLCLRPRRRSDRLLLHHSESGQLTIGTATPDPDGKTLHQEFDVMQPDGKTQHIRSTLVRDGNDAYWLQRVPAEQTGEWAEVFKIRYERK